MAWKRGVQAETLGLREVGRALGKYTTGDGHGATCSALEGGSVSGGSEHRGWPTLSSENVKRFDRLRTTTHL